MYWTTMRVSYFRSGLLLGLIAAFISGCQSQKYEELEVLGVNCPTRDRCAGYKNDSKYTDRSCECDPDCATYDDCCIDAQVLQNRSMRSSGIRTDVKCLQYGTEGYSKHTGIYVINTCSSSWNGSREVIEKCVGADDFSDPIVAAPVTDVALNKTFRNRACAQCNDANLTSLKTFVLMLISYEWIGEVLTEEQIMENLIYSEEHGLWGVNRSNIFGDGADFAKYHIIYDVPEYLKSNVRFCRPNLISTCATNWTRPVIETRCAQYMAAVYSDFHDYRNPHCAICNYKALDEVSCEIGTTARRMRWPRIILVLDVNPSDGFGYQVAPECEPGHIYDTFFKRCRQLLCALPHQVVVNGKCVNE